MLGHIIKPIFTILILESGNKIITYDQTINNVINRSKKSR